MGQSQSGLKTKSSPRRMSIQDEMKSIVESTSLASLEVVAKSMEAIEEERNLTQREFLAEFEKAFPEWVL